MQFALISINQCPAIISNTKSDRWIFVFCSITTKNLVYIVCTFGHSVSFKDFQSSLIYNQTPTVRGGLFLVQTDSNIILMICYQLLKYSYYKKTLPHI